MNCQLLKSNFYLHVCNPATFFLSLFVFRFTIKWHTLKWHCGNHFTFWDEMFLEEEAIHLLITVRFVTTYLDFFFFPHFKLWEAIVVKMSLCGTHCTSCDAGGLRCVLEEHTQVPVGSQWAWKEEDFSIKLQQDFSTFVQETQGENSVSNINAPLFSLRRSMLSIVLFPVNLSNVSSHRFAG